MSAKLAKQAYSEALAEVWQAFSPEQRAPIEAAAALPDDEINANDVPEVLDWSGAVRGRFYRPLKRQLTLRVDADVVDWFQKEAPKGGYQTMMNRALRAAMLRGQRRRA